MPSARVPMAVLVVALHSGCRSPSNGTDGDGADGESSSTTATMAETITSEDPDATETKLTGETSGFVPPPYDFAFTDACDPFLQDCPDGEKCVMYEDGYVCVPVLGDRGEGEPCTWDGPHVGTDDCDAATACYEGICTPFCLGTADDPTCPPGFGCNLAQSVTQTVCLATWCDPLVPNECEDQTACYWVGDSFECRPPLGAAGPGEVCTQPRDCDPANFCADAAAVPNCVGSCCTPLCGLDLGDAPCDGLLPGTVCVPVFEPDPAPEWFAHVGICMLP